MTVREREGVLFSLWCGEILLGRWTHFHIGWYSHRELVNNNQ